MANKTNIEWTDYNWNFLRGCCRVSEGCRNCYAEGIAARFSGPGQPYEGLAVFKDHKARWTGEIGFFEDVLSQPLRWTKPRKVFVNSMSDLFHEKVTDDILDKAFAVMALTPQHTYQILTKRPERMREWFYEKWQPGLEQQIGRFHIPAETVGEDRRCQVSRAVDDLVTEQKLIDFESDDVWTPEGSLKVLNFPWPLPNVHLGVSVEDQKTADERIPILLQTPAALRWLSMEPLLGHVDIHEWLPDEWSGVARLESPYGDPPPINWVVVGGESGPNARPMHPEWVRSIRDQCVAVGVPFFFKQWGEWGDAVKNKVRATIVIEPNGATRPTHNALPSPGSVWMCKVGKHNAGRILDGREWNEMPEGK